jgi:hypothetical protein
VVWKSIKHLSKTKSVKHFPSLKLCFPCFSFSLVLFDCNCARCKYGATMIGPGPGSLALNQHRVSGDQQDSVDSAGLCRHGPVTVFIEFLNNKLCHFDVFGWISCDNQKSQKNREILPKVIKITKSGHTELAFQFIYSSMDETLSSAEAYMKFLVREKWARKEWWEELNKGSLCDLMQSIWRRTIVPSELRNDRFFRRFVSDSFVHGRTMVLSIMKGYLCTPWSGRDKTLKLNRGNGNWKRKLKWG